MTAESGRSDPSPRAAHGGASDVVSRRSMLAGAAGTGASLLGLGWLGACGSSTGTSTGAGGTTTEPAARLGMASTPNASKGGKVLVARFDNSAGYLTTGTEQRLTFGLGSVAGEIVSDGPDAIDMTIMKDGRPVGAPVPVAKRRAGIPTAYYALRTTFTDAGIYSVVAQLDGRQVDQAFEVAASGPSSIPAPGGRLTPFDTPTTADHRGVEPICTRTPEPCPFHDVTVTEALARGGPLGFIISTPAFCQMAICGPVLDLMIRAQKDFPTYTFVHADVYKDAEARGNFEKAEIAPVVGAYGMTFEPCLFVADATGTVVDRLDNVFDDGELRAALQKGLGA